MDTELEENQEEESDNQKPKQTIWEQKPWLFKPGQSGNPKGRPKGKTLKTFAREYLESLPDKEKLEYIKGMDKKDIWEMAEGKPKQDLDIKGEVISKIVSVDE